MLIGMLAGLCVILALLLIILVLRSGKQAQDLLLHQKLDSLKEDLTRNVVQTQTSLIDSQKGITEELTRLYKEIGTINQESSQILTLTKSFHDILKPTKRRGMLGESILENIINDVLPGEVVVAQYGFRNGKKVDFLIKLPHGNLPVDAKFSMEPFTAFLEAKDEDRDRLKKVFSDSIKRRIDEASGYVLPDEGTVEFAFMYVPSEAIYYTLITETDILDYAQKKRVFLMGPNTFYVYLKTILVGFEALKIEKKAKVIYECLKRLELEMENSLREYGILGTHIRSASTKYEDVRKKLEGIQFKLSHTEMEEDAAKEKNISEG